MTSAAYSYSSADIIAQQRRAARNGPPTTWRGEAAFMLGLAAYHRRRFASMRQRRDVFATFEGAAVRRDIARVRWLLAENASKRNGAALDATLARMPEIA